MSSIKIRYSAIILNILFSVLSDAQDRTAQLELYLLVVNHSSQTTIFYSEATSVIYEFNTAGPILPINKFQSGGLTITGNDSSFNSGWKFEPFSEGAIVWDTLGFGVYRFYTSISYDDPYFIMDYTDCRYMRQGNPDPYTYKDLLLKFDAVIVLFIGNRVNLVYGIPFRMVIP